MRNKRVFGKGFPAAGEPMPENKLLESPEFYAYAQMVLDTAIRRLKGNGGSQLGPVPGDIPPK